MAYDLQPKGIHQTLSLEEFDRCNERRTDKVWLNDVLKSVNSRFIIFCGLKILTVPETDIEMSSLCKLTYEELSTAFGEIYFESDKFMLIFLGSNVEGDSKYYFSCSFSYKDEDLHEKVLAAVKNDACDFVDLRVGRVASTCSRFDYALALQARPLVDWNLRYKYCATCGSQTISKEAGHKRSCCNKECSSNRGVHNTCFPRTDPVCIMMVVSKDNQRCLLGRKKIFPPCFYSCLAGFIEPGETLEDAVKREVKEESNISVEDVQYMYSQPWPYPSCLMLGCFAVATTSEITICEEELEDVKWFSRKDVVNAFNDPGSVPNFFVPPSYTIASQLIQSWVRDGRELSSL